MNNDACISYASITLLTTITRHRCQGGKLRDLSFIGRINQSNSPGSELHLLRFNRKQSIPGKYGDKWFKSRPRFCCLAS